MKKEKLTIEEIKERHLFWDKKKPADYTYSENKIEDLQYWLVFRQEAYWSARIALAYNRNSDNWSFWMRSCRYWKKGVQETMEELKVALKEAA